MTDEPIDTKIDEIFFDNYNKLHDNIFASEFEAAKSATKAIKELFLTSEADIRIETANKAIDIVEDEYQKSRTIGRVGEDGYRRLFVEVTLRERIKNRIKDLVLESGTADTTGLALDKHSVRKDTKFGKGK